MGYYTRFEGSVTGPAELMEQFETDAEAGDRFGSYDMELDEWLSGDLMGGDTIKWYGWEDDIKALSRKYPALLFSLEGEGEESGDIWKAWARNGKVVTAQAKIVFETPDLDAVLPSPDTERMIAEQKAKKVAEIDAEIARLQAERDSI